MSFNTLKSQYNIDSIGMIHMVNAEVFIMSNNYSKALNEYNKSFDFVKPTTNSIYNYLTILKNDTNLFNCYIDSLTCMLMKYNINIDNYMKNFFKIRNKIKYNCIIGRDKNKTICDHLDSIFTNLQNKDREIRNEIIKSGVPKDKMYITEPFKSKISKIDLENYETVLNVLKDTNNNLCLYKLLTYRTLIRHFFQFKPIDSINFDEILIEKAFNGYIDKRTLAEILDNDYNQSSRYKYNKNYNFSKDILITNSYVFFPSLNNDELIELEKNRKKFGLEPYAHYCRKIIWQIENRGCGFILTTINALFMGYNEKQEEEMMEYLIREKKIDFNRRINYKFKERVVDFFK
jgi:hypothetical protein